MHDDCKGIQEWFNCLNCSFLNTSFCPLEGDDALDRIANKIRMMEDPSFDGFKKELSKHK